MPILKKPLLASEEQPHLLKQEPVWSCEFTGESNLTFEQALSSEQKVEKEIEQIPQPLLKPIFELVQFNTSSIEVLVDSIYENLKNYFYPGEQASIIINDSFKRVEIIGPSGLNFYTFQYHDPTGLFEGSVSKDQLNRLFDIKKHLIKKLIRWAAKKDSFWILKSFISKQFQISEQVPEELLAGLARSKKSVESHFVIEIPIRKKPEFDASLTVPLEEQDDLLMSWYFLFAFSPLLKSCPLPLFEFEKALLESSSFLVESIEALLKLLADEGKRFGKENFKKIVLETLENYETLPCSNSDLFPWNSIDLKILNKQIYSFIYENSVNYPSFLSSSIESFSSRIKVLSLLIDLSSRTTLIRNSVDKSFEQLKKQAKDKAEHKTLLYFINREINDLTLKNRDLSLKSKEFLESQGNPRLDVSQKEILKNEKEIVKKRKEEIKENEAIKKANFEISKFDCLRPTFLGFDLQDNSYFLFDLNGSKETGTNSILVKTLKGWFCYNSKEKLELLVASLIERGNEIELKKNLLKNFQEILELFTRTFDTKKPSSKRK